jgi:hypothetical protein
LSLRLLVRTDCHLCEVTASLLDDLAVQYDRVDVDSDPALVALYDEAVPVVLDGDREIARAPIDRAGLIEALRSAGLRTGRR